MKKIIAVASSVLLAAATAIAVCAADTTNWIAGNGYNVVDAEKQVVSENSPVTIDEKSETVVEVSHGGYYQNGENWGGVASKNEFDLENLAIRVTYTQVPEVYETTDCWMYVGVLSKPEMFKVGDIPSNPGYVNLIRFGGRRIEIYDGIEAWKNVATVSDCPELFEIKTGDVLNVMFIKDSEGLYHVRYVKGDYTYTTEAAFDFDKALGGKGHVVVSASRIESEKDAFKYTVEVNPAPATPDISVFVDGKKVSFEDQQPVIVEERTLVPLRAIFEALGASVKWNDEEKSVFAFKGQDSIKLTTGSNQLYKNGEPVYELDVPAQILNEKTVVPVRAISESFGCDVDWIGSLRAVIVTSK